MEKTVNGKSWKMEKAGRWKKLEKAENGKGRKWKIKKVLTLCRDSDRIPTTGKTRPAMIAEKKNGG